MRAGIATFGVGGVPVLGQLDLNTTVESSTVEGLGFYRAASGGRNDNPAALDVLAGARYYGMSTELNATLPAAGGVTSGKRTFTWVDGLIGLRFRAPLSSRVTFIGRGDMAGLGSKFTWNVDYDKAGTDRQLFNLAYDGPRVWFAYAW